MGPAHFDECLAKGYHFFGGDEEGAKLGFGSRRHDEFDDLGDGKDGTIEAWKRVIFREENVSTSSAVRVAFIIETSICVCSKHHATSSVRDAIMGMGGAIIKELMDGSRGGFSGSGLLTTNGAESNK